MEIVTKVLLGLGVFIVIILPYLVVIIFFPVLSAPKQPLQKSKQPEKRI